MREVVIKSEMPLIHINLQLTSSFSYPECYLCFGFSKFMLTNLEGDVLVVSDMFLHTKSRHCFTTRILHGSLLEVFKNNKWWWEDWVFAICGDHLPPPLPTTNTNTTLHLIVGSKLEIFITLLKNRWLVWLVHSNPVNMTSSILQHIFARPNFLVQYSLFYTTTTLDNATFRIFALSY